MSILSAVTTGKTIGAQIHTVAGNNGVGKTTFAASFPKPLILDLENGSEHLDVARITSDKLKTLVNFRAVLKEIAESKHDYKTIAIDSAEALESLICDQVCQEGKVDSIEKYEGGYGKGYSRSREIMREIMIELQMLKQKGISTVIVAHTQTKNITDPATNQTYDRVVMRCNDKMAAVIRDLSDNVFYATFKVLTSKDNGKTKAWGDGQRVLYTQWRPGYDAKNRLELPLEIPLSYDAFKEACENPQNINETLILEIKEMSANMKDDLKKQVKEMIEKFKTDSAKLQEVKNRLMKYVAA